MSTEHTPQDGRTRIAHDLRAFLASASWQYGDPETSITVSTADGVRLINMLEALGERRKADGDAMLADAHACDVDRACRLLSARDYGDCYAYVDAPTGCAYVVGDRAMAALGRMLADDTPDAYVAWSTTTGATAVDPHVIVQRLSAGDDLDDLRARADACADFITVVAIDLLRPTLEAILAYDADAAAEEDANDEAPAPGSDTVGRALY